MCWPAEVDLDACPVLDRNEIVSLPSTKACIVEPSGDALLETAAMADASINSSGEELMQRGTSSNDPNGRNRSHTIAHIRRPSHSMSPRTIHRAPSVQPDSYTALMPHVIVEYSANLEQHADMGALLSAVHRAALASGVAALDALRTRAEPRASYVIADDHVDNAFVAVLIRIGPGRTPDQKRTVIDAVLRAVEMSLGEAVDAAMLTVEVQEIDPEFRVNKNHLRSAIALRQATQEA